MAQHDTIIDNASGAAVRADINAALAAIFSTSSGATAPATTVAEQWWADTTNNLLKQRNAANSGWIVRGTIAETFVLSRSSNTIIGVGDFGRTIVAMAAFTQTLTAAATLGDGFVFKYRNASTGVVPIDPNGAETIDGVATINLQPGESCDIVCNGSSFFTIGRRRINDLTEDTFPDEAADYVEMWDASAGGHKKVLLKNARSHIVKRKTADESVTSSVVLQDDDHLSFSIAANEEWVATFELSAGDGLSTTGISLAITTPTGATQELDFWMQTAAAKSGFSRSLTSGTAVNFGAAEFGGFLVAGLRVTVWVLNGANAGSVKLQFAQATSSGTATTLKKGSYLIAHRVA